MPELFEVYPAIRYIFPDRFVPVKQLVNHEEKDPYAVRPIYGSIGFDFVRIIVFEVEDDEQLRHLVADPETYYWGQEVFLEELTEIDGLEGLEGLTSAERFAYTETGGLIALAELEIVIPYPEIHELPANMRLEG